MLKLIVSLNRDPFVVKRVRSLVLGPSLSEEVFEQHEQWANPENPLLRMRNARGYFKQGISSCDLIANMISVVRGFNSITELTIDSESDTLFPLVRAILDSSRTSLLKLKITHIFVLSFLPLEFTLPNLMHFDVILEDQGSCTLHSIPTPVLKHIAAFITTHENTLQSVALVLPKPLDSTEVFDPLLEALSRIAHLRDLRMVLPFHSIPASILRSLVESIGSSLQDLRLRTRYTSAEENGALSWIRHDLPLCPFPNLRTLAVGRRLLPTHYNGAIQWFQAFGTVTKLDLRYDVPVTYKDYDYETLLQFLGSQNTIKCLRLEVPLLDSHLLTQLASNFESLQWLYLTFWRVELHTEEKDREKVRANPIVSLSNLLDLNLDFGLLDHA